MPRGFAAQQRNQFVIDDFNHLLGRAYAFERFLPQALFAHAFHKVFDNLEVDVRFQERQPHFAQTGLHVFLGELAAPAERAEYAGKSVGKALEHEDPASAAVPSRGRQPQSVCFRAATRGRSGDS